jgi:hypothetical protein
MFADIRKAQQLQTSMLEPLEQDWITESGWIFPVGDPKYEGATRPCEAYDFSACWHSPSDVASA